MKRKKITPIPVLCRQRYECNGPTLQQQFEAEFKKVPEFDFYQTSKTGVPPEGLSVTIFDSDEESKDEYWPAEEDESSSHYTQYMAMLYSPERPNLLFSIKSRFIEVREMAKSLERQKNYKEAVRLYEWLVGQGYPMPFAYDRLITLYTKHKLLSEAVFTANEAIQHFKELKAKQLTYVGNLANKYGALDYFLDRINAQQKVFYYGGSFELYNPFPIIDTWEQKLNRLCKLKTT